MPTTRTTVTAVRQIIATTLSNTQLLAFLQDANLWVTEMLGASTLSPARLEAIERYLTCALARLRDLGATNLSSVTVGDVSETYRSDTELADYLSRAAAFDTTGVLRQHFFAPKPVAEPTAPITGMDFRVGPGFTEDL